MDLLFKFPLRVTFWRQLKFSLNSITPFLLPHKCIYESHCLKVSWQRNSFICATYVGFSVSSSFVHNFNLLMALQKHVLTRQTAMIKLLTRQTAMIKQIPVLGTHCVAQKRIGLNCYFLKLHMI